MISLMYLADQNVAVTNSDDDTVGIFVSAISGNTTEDGVAATFTIFLESEPTADVTIPLSSSDLGEGTIRCYKRCFECSQLGYGGGCDGHRGG